ncbi:DUF3592 domain-containing protein [Streptomyces albidoflavus]
MAAALGTAVSVGIAGVLLVIAFMNAFNVGLPRWTEPDRRADAVVSGHVQVRSGGGPIGARWEPQVTYEAEGHRYTARLQGATEGRLEVGDAVEVVYRPEKPGRPFTQSYADAGPPGPQSRALAVGLTLFMAVVALIFAWWQTDFLRQSWRTPPDGRR